MDWIAITCWVVLGASGLLALWAMFWDRPRGRLRCRKCAYDMSGGGLVCPECGREHKAERSLKRTRRKWKTAVLALLAAILAIQAQHQRDLIYYEGVSGLLPAVTLVVLADPSVIETGIGRYWTGIESKLHTRMMMDRSSSVADWIWTRKIANYMQDTSVNADQFVDVYDMSDIVSEDKLFPTDSSYTQAVRDGRATAIGEIRRLHSETIVTTVLARLSVSNYEIGKSKEIEYYLDSGSVVLRANRRVHGHFATSLEEIRARSWSVDRSSLPAVSTTACYVLYRINVNDEALSTSLNASNVVYQHINNWLLPGAFDPAYEPSRVAIVSNGFIVWADPEDHIEIIEYLHSLSSLQ